LDGRPLKGLDPRWLRQQIGVVSQEPILFSTSIAANIRYGREDATDAQVEAAARAANAHEFISRFPEGYKTEVGERGVQLSGGQKQRVAIARAMFNKPRVILCDEPTGSLDRDTGLQILELFQDLSASEGLTMIVVTHEEHISRMASRIVRLEDGALASDTPNEPVKAR
jgi:ATP-binding cassette subfamily B protein